MSNLNFVTQMIEDTIKMELGQGHDVFYQGKKHRIVKTAKLANGTKIFLLEGRPLPVFRREIKPTVYVRG
ncbi:hypothetical protein Scuro_23 [Acinetobacter phage Scuro]|nr:hypothetical protein Scuro_23 [Acinetobacter phage Scuro]